MPKRNNANSGSLGIHALTWRSFTQANPGASYVPISASFVPLALSVTAQDSNGNGNYYGFWSYNFYVAGSGTYLPAWIRPGTPIQINASITIGSTSYNLSDDYVVVSVDASGTFFTVNANRPTGGRDGAAINRALTKTDLDSGSGAVTSPTINLITQAQKVLMQATSGSVTIAPCVDKNNNAPVSYTLTAGGQLFEKTAPTGAKFDLADWYVTGTGTLGVEFL